MSSIRSIVCLIVILCVTVTCSKPRITPRIYGGHLADVHQFPFIASVQVKNRHNVLVHICGATILSSKLLLTAAHCTDSKRRNADLYRIFIGANDKSNGKMFQVERFLTHPLYNSVFLKNDLMFIKLSTQIQFSTTVQPIALNRQIIGEGVRVFAVGFGKSNDEISSLKSIELETLSNHICHAALLSETPRPPVYYNVICAYSGYFGHGICDGDSGGPLIYNNSLIGVSTWAFGCAEAHPDGFHRISSFTDWIDEMLNFNENN